LGAGELAHHAHLSIRVQAWAKPVTRRGRPPRPWCTGAGAPAVTADAIARTSQELTEMPSAPAVRSTWTLSGSDRRSVIRAWSPASAAGGSGRSEERRVGTG